MCLQPFYYAVKQANNNHLCSYIKNDYVEYVYNCINEDMDFLLKDKWKYFEFVCDSILTNKHTHTHSYILFYFIYDGTAIPYYKKYLIE